MKKAFLSLLICVMTATLVFAGGDREKVPKVRYIEPKNDAVIDINEYKTKNDDGEEVFLFSWKGPTPGGGRLAYKFELFKEFGYERVVSETLDYDVHSIEIPVEKFEPGVLYTWQVKQRDARTRYWSMDYRWSFRIKK